MLRGTRRQFLGAQPKKTTAGVLQWPAGRELVAAAGVLFIGIAAYQAYLGLSKKFLSTRRPARCRQPVLQGVHAVGEVGLVARAVAFALIGVFALKAARDYTPKDAVGIDGALARLLAARLRHRRR